jgi:hypothetical protein
MPILKVFVGKEDGPAVLKQSTLIEPYDAFLLVQATLAAARPRITTAGKVRPARRTSRWPGS